jgi:hypothetical protein
MISQKEEMRTGTESSGVVLHDMIERIYFYFIIFSQKEMGSKKHTADVVLPAESATVRGDCLLSTFCHCDWSGGSMILSLTSIIERKKGNIVM